jgi:uncharacterized membrane protein
MIGSSLGAVHFTSAVAALVLGAIVLGAPKGTTSHRIFGAGYVAAMFLLNASALAVYRLTGHFEPFHALALISAATILRGIVAALRRRPGWLIAHYRNMAWSYISVLAAGCTELLVRLSIRGSAFTSPWQIIATGLVIAGVFVIMGLILLERLKRTAVAQ